MIPTHFDHFQRGGAGPTVLRKPNRGQFGFKCSADVSIVAYFKARPVHAKFTSSIICHVADNGQRGDFLFFANIVHIHF